MARACRCSPSSGVAVETSSPSAVETAVQIGMTGQSPERSNSSIVPSAPGPPGDRAAVHRDRRLLDELLGEHAHRDVVVVGVVDLERGELRVVRGVGALVAELPPELEDLLHAADDEPLEVQLGRDAQRQLEVVGVDVGLERAGVRPAVHQLEDRRLDLDVAAVLQRLADAAHDRRAQVGDVAGRGPHDEVDVPHPHPGLGVGEAEPLVGQRAQRLRGQRERVRVDAQLAPGGGDHVAGDPDVVAEVEAAEEPVLVVAEHRAGRHHLDVTRAVTDRQEAQAAVVTLAQHPADDRDDVRAAGAGRQVAGAGPHLGQRVRAGVADRVGVDALRLQALELGAAHPFLVGQPPGRQRLLEAVGLGRDGGPHLRGVRLVGPVELVAAGAAPAQDRADRRGAEEALGAAGGDPDPRQVGGVLEADEPGLPLGQVLGVGAVERLQLPVAAGEQQRLAAQARHRPGAELLAAGERLAEHREVQRHPAHGQPRRLLGQRADEQLDQAVVGGRVAAHQVEREAVASPRHEADEAAQLPLPVVGLDEHAVAVERVAEPAERHREAALVATVTAPATTPRRPAARSPPGSGCRGAAPRRRSRGGAAGSRPGAPA